MCQFMGIASRKKCGMKDPPCIPPTYVWQTMAAAPAKSRRRMQDYLDGNTVEEETPPVNWRICTAAEIGSATRNQELSNMCGAEPFWHTGPGPVLPRTRGTTVSRFVVSQGYDSP